MPVLMQGFSSARAIPPLDAPRNPPYNAAQDDRFRDDHYSNYFPGALRQEPPGQGVWNATPIS
ncbi:hypothetical protein RXV86_14815 [Alisedimentitalea sp. MJ-SS2]|uniref:hypothetical protein n=1 Tax=Aliisedimentitalea sp. MJ-SS2 TaxID=3049795 RepID=UPI00290D244A|nr:hypothetical protein [Alisedimentitalea sp. MJ-SS2]MDU8928661.1 hypothetical protein [Alisedimentitalea sp. MJ-SS2]